MKTLQSMLTGMTLVVSLGLAPTLVSVPALAVDNIQSTDAPDLTSVRAKIKASDYAGALAELRDLAEDTQQADVYNLLVSLCARLATSKLRSPITLRRWS